MGVLVVLTGGVGLVVWGWWGEVGWGGRRVGDPNFFSSDFF